MEKVSFKKILSEKANFAIHCETAAEAKSLFRRLQKEGFKWAISKDEINEENTYWHERKNKSVYILNIEMKKLSCRWFGATLLTRAATPFKQICFCDCESCKFDTQLV